MARTVIPLTDPKCEAARPRDKDYSLFDGQGLFLLVKASGTKVWRFKYSRPDGRAGLATFGNYPALTLKAARTRRAVALELLAHGKDPIEQARKDKLDAANACANTFEALALEWHQHKAARWSVGYAADVLEAFEKDIFPRLGSQSLAGIKPMEWLTVFRRIEARGALEKLRKVRQRCQEVYRFAIATGRAEYNPIADVGGALQTPVLNHYPFLPVADLPALLATIRAFSAAETVKLATHLLVLTGVRTSELRCAPWTEFDLETGVWAIPAERMKMRRPHLVPLSSQALDVLRQLQALTGGYTLALPGRNDPAKPMSEAAINQLLKRCGYEGKTTGHGFRHTLSTTLHEQGYPSEWIETQLAHVDKNTIRGTYNHAQYVDGRRQMLQWYADHLDKLAGGNVVAIKRA